MKDEMIWGRRPVVEAFRAGRRKFRRVYVASDSRGGTFDEVIALASDKKVPLENVTQKRLDKLSGTHDHQGVVAVVSPLEDTGLASLLEVSAARSEPPFLVLLDGITDPQNLGAILRTCEAAGVHGVIVGERATAPLARTTAKASAGALEHVAVARVKNLGMAVRHLKEQGLWVASAHAGEEDKSLYETDLTGPLLLVLGDEGKGVSKQIRGLSDMLVSIPMSGKIESLNVSAAAAVLLFEVRRRRLN